MKANQDNVVLAIARMLDYRTEASFEVGSGGGERESTSVKQNQRRRGAGPAMGSVRTVVHRRSGKLLGFKAFLPRDLSVVPHGCKQPHEYKEPLGELMPTREFAEELLSHEVARRRDIKVARKMFDALAPLNLPNSPGVYCISDGTDCVKIGKAESSIRSRVRGLTTAHHRPLTLLAVLSTDPAKESHFHGEFAADRVRGEWFRISTRLAEAIRVARRMP